MQGGRLRDLSRQAGQRRSRDEGQLWTERGRSRPRLYPELSGGAADRRGLPRIRCLTAPSFVRSLVGRAPVLRRTDDPVLEVVAAGTEASASVHFRANRPVESARWKQP